MTAWKRTERAVAKALGGKRTSKMGLGANAPDVETDAWSIEVKHRDQLPQWLTEALAQAVRNASDGKLPLVVLHESGRRHADDLVLLRLGDFEQWFGEMPTPKDEEPEVRVV